MEDFLRELQKRESAHGRFLTRILLWWIRRTTTPCRISRTSLTRLACQGHLSSMFHPFLKVPVHPLAFGVYLSINPTLAFSLPKFSLPSTSVGKPNMRTVSSGTYPTSSSTHTASFSEAERKRKQQEFAESHPEQFCRAQESLVAERQLKSAGRPLSREELRRVFEHHERLWACLNTLYELSWNDFPWPMAKQPLNLDDMSLNQIGAYIHSPLYPDKDKSRTPTDRIKEHIKRWDPRFKDKVVTQSRGG